MINAGASQKMVKAEMLGRCAAFQSNGVLAEHPFETARSAFTTSTLKSLISKVVFESYAHRSASAA
jgi:hypothetical protein